MGYIVETPNNTGNDKVHVSNSLMYSAVKNHSYWNSIFIEMELKKNSSYYYTSRHITIMMTTGPGIINRIFNKYKYRYKLNHYPCKLFHPYGVSDDAKTLSNCNKEQDVYAYHIQDGCWHKKDTVILNFIYQEYKIILAIILLLIIPLLFKK
jgi:hypothetical protein